MQLGLYRHYKGNLYHVMVLARNTETLEEVVVYQSLYGDYGVWVRPKTMFLEHVLHDGTEIPRFTFIQATLTVAPTYR